MLRIVGFAAMLAVVKAGAVELTAKNFDAETAGELKCLRHGACATTWRRPLCACVRACVRARDAAARCACRQGCLH